MQEDFKLLILILPLFCLIFLPPLFLNLLLLVADSLESDTLANLIGVRISLVLVGEILP